MRGLRDEDLFKNSTMTFGEHLEELRSCLIKAILGLTVGFVLGLLIGDRVVDYIQRPLRKALEEYYATQSAAKIEEKLQSLRDAGYAMPADPAKIKAIVAEKSLILEEVYINPAEFRMDLKEGDSKAGGPNKVAKPLPATGVDFSSSNDLVRVFLWRPIKDDARVKTKSLSAHEAFSIYIKASLLVGGLLTSPWIFYQIWSFVGAGLYPHEKKYVHIFLPMSVGLFISGALLAFFFVFQPVLDFLFYFNSQLGIDPDPRISEWMSFVLVMPLGFGVAFQLPLVMLFLERIGIFNVRTYLSKWRIAILVIFLISSVFTPPDPTSLLLMACPLSLLYFGGVLLCHFLPRAKSPYDELD